MSNFLKVRAESLFIYPVKACGGIRVPRLHFTTAGSIEGDREWVVVDGNGEVVWQGSHPRLALVRPMIHDTMLVLESPGISPIEISMIHSENPCRICLWNDSAKISESYIGFDAGSHAAEFLHRVTGSELRLVRLDANAVSRNSVNPVHLMSTSSLHELNQFLSATGPKPAEMIRFRPNIVLGGIDEPLLPFIEEQFTRLKWTSDAGSNSMTIIGQCIRCIVPNVDPVTAEVSDEPLIAVTKLSAQRFPGGPSYLGIYGKPLQRAALLEQDILEAELSF